MWYSAKLIFRSEIVGLDDGVTDEAGTEAGVIEEVSIRLIEADHEAHARSRANLIGLESQVAYQNEFGETVRWNFAGVEEIQDLCESTIRSGMEVYSMMSRIDNRQRGMTD